MRKLRKREPRKIYYFLSENTPNKRLRKFDGEEVSEEEIIEFEIPSFLLEQEKNANKNERGIRKTP